MKVFKIKNPDASYDDIVEMVVCAESLEDVKNRLTYNSDARTTEVTGFKNNNEYFFRHFDKHPYELIIEEVTLDEPKIICVDIWEG